MVEWWGPIAAGAGVTGAVGSFGYFMDNKLDDAFRSKVRDKLTRATPKGIAAGDENWPSLFLAMFDRLFDPKGKGRPHFWRSAAASMVVLAALLVAWAILLPERAGQVISVLGSDSFIVVLLIVLFVIPINIVGDFGSLWQSRFVIGRMAVTPYTINKTAFLLLDLIATVGIFVLAFALGAFGAVYLASVFASIFDSEVMYLGSLIIASNELFDFVTSGRLLGSLLFSSDLLLDLFVIFFYTTLFTSVWVWLFMLGGVLWSVFTWLRGVLSVEKFPVGSAMAIGGVFGGLVVTALGYVRMAVLT